MPETITNAQYKTAGLHDELTDIYNRIYFEKEIQRLSCVDAYPVTIITADLDGLKLINDSAGHKTGDKLLKLCADFFKKTLRKNDVLARIGEDEFSVILPETDEKTGEMIIKRVEELTEAHNEENPHLPVKISMGLATAEKDKTPVDAFKEAEDLMCCMKVQSENSLRYQVMAALMAALGERDYITRGHVQRLEKYSLEMGRSLGLSYRRLCNLSLLTKVHDLGKMGISDRILTKKGPLNQEERRKMNQHSEKGWRIALASPDLVSAADLILKHHERWDGNGYPLGIKGEEIPVECRILAIVDAFDAMTNDRPYRKRRSTEEALEELLRCASTQFDPELVKLFLSICKKNGGENNESIDCG